MFLDRHIKWTANCLFVLFDMAAVNLGIAISQSKHIFPIAKQLYDLLDRLGQNDKHWVMMILLFMRRMQYDNRNFQYNSWCSSFDLS